MDGDHYLPNLAGDAIDPDSPVRARPLHEWVQSQNPTLILPRWPPDDPDDPDDPDEPRGRPTVNREQ